MITMRELFSDLQFAIMPSFGLKITLVILLCMELIQKIPEKIISHLENYQE